MSLLSDAASDLESIFSTDEIGESITYTPADALIDPFAAVVVIGPISRDRFIEAHVYGDLAECRILHSALSDAGVSEPTAYIEATTGDQITRKDPNGNDEDWKVVADRNNPVEYSPAGYWTFLIAKDVRIIP